MRLTGVADHIRHQPHRNSMMVQQPIGNTALLRHAQFWDRKNKGYITPRDTVAGLMNLGYSMLFSIFLGTFLSITIAYATQDAWLLLDPRCRIHINKLVHAKRQRDHDIYDVDGNFNIRQFDRLYDKYARWDISGNTMTLSEAMHMASEQGSFGASPTAWTRALFEWLLLYLIISKGGLFGKNAIQAVYDGSLFYQIHDTHQEQQRQQSKKAKAQWGFIPFYSSYTTSMIEVRVASTVVPIVQEPMPSSPRLSSLPGVKIHEQPSMTEGSASDDTSKEFGTRFSCFVREPEALLVEDEVTRLSGPLAKPVDQEADVTTTKTQRRVVRFDDEVSETRYDEDEPISRKSILGIFVPEPATDDDGMPNKSPDEPGIHELGLLSGLLRSESVAATFIVPDPNHDVQFHIKEIMLEPVVLCGLLPTDATTEFAGFVSETMENTNKEPILDLDNVVLSGLRPDAEFAAFVPDPLENEHYIKGIVDIEPVVLSGLRSDGGGEFVGFVPEPKEKHRNKQSIVRDDDAESSAIILSGLRTEEHDGVKEYTGDGLPIVTIFADESQDGGGEPFIASESILSGMSTKSVKKPLKNWLNNGVLTGIVMKEGEDSIVYEAATVVPDEVGSTTPPVDLDTLRSAYPLSGVIHTSASSFGYEDVTNANEPADYIGIPEEYKTFSGTVMDAGSAPVKNWLAIDSLSGFVATNGTVAVYEQAGEDIPQDCITESQEEDPGYEEGKTLSGILVEEEQQSACKSWLCTASLSDVDVAELTLEEEDEETASRVTLADKDSPPQEWDDDSNSMSTPSDTTTGDNSPELIAHQFKHKESNNVIMHDDDWPLLADLATQKEE